MFLCQTGEYSVVFPSPGDRVIKLHFVDVLHRPVYYFNYNQLEQNILKIVLAVSARNIKNNY